ncbi:growth arrest-specific protein 8 [Cimex lectularius]|uniref:Dynein regulatory complex subunit 4 n=1 Tax=Cimex lectularius TaxID=79782 RepID=A0A8I6SS91_CIMLE|nr:growth arrest-specific protein 8 [Cimex lectularius]
MGPKKKVGKASKGGRGSGGIIDGVPMTEMPREHLEKYTLRIRDELEREREERNFFQLERDKIRTFWEITRQQQEENKAELRNKDRALEEAEEKHQTELKEFNEKVKHLMYEHQCHLTEVKAESMVSLRMAQEEYQKQEARLNQEKEELQKKIVDEQLTHEEKIREIYLKHTEEVYGIREEFMEKIKEMAIKAEERVEKIREHFSLKNKMELAETEERKNTIIDKLNTSHKVALLELKTYYTGVIDNNLAVITAMKEEMGDVMKQNEGLKESMTKVLDENKKLAKPLEEAKARVAELEKQLIDNKKDKISLKNVHKRYAKICKDLEDVTLQRDSYEMQIEKVEEQLEEMTKKYTTALSEIQKKNGIQVNIFEKKITDLEDELEKKEISMAQLIAEANIEPSAVNNANKKIQAIMAKRAKKIEMLQLEINRVAKAHNDLILDFKNKAAIFDIPEEAIAYDFYRLNLNQFDS